MKKEKRRLIIEHIRPLVNNGEFPIKRVVEEFVHINADIIADGHDVLQAEVVHYLPNQETQQYHRLYPIENDGYKGRFQVNAQGYHAYFLQAWVDHPLTWHKGITAKIDNQIGVKSELLEGVIHLKTLKKLVQDKNDNFFLDHLIEIFPKESHYDEACKEAKSKRLYDLFYRFPTKENATQSDTFEIDVDRKKARFSTWYEFFPRSAPQDDGQHANFKDCEKLLPRVAEMGFDTLYFPPIHPIGEVNRKGKNNKTNAENNDTGVPWAIGSKLGGHKSIHPELGTEEDFMHLIHQAEQYGIEIAMDIAFQAAPDHPYLKDHPEWFKFRPDGSIQYAENPPKKYQDIVNFNFECEAAVELWNELLSVGKYWAKRGVKIFRVDNPHTKSFRFWNFFIRSIKQEFPDTIFLSEAFSRPRIMQQLAKQGFNQGYTYFTWRTHKYELVEYVKELTQSNMREYFRPNFWPNTPDINPFHLQGANEAMHMIRYTLAATLSSNIGIYGPVFEYMVSDAMPGKEEYLDSEKYQIRKWDWNYKNKLTHLIGKINRIRKNHPALQQTNNIRFCTIENENLIGFYKWNDDLSDQILVVININHHYSQQGSLRLPFEELGISPGTKVVMKDLITEATYDWNNEWNFVELHPNLGFHIFKMQY
jgi:starch synthase (maltosyl-transferring)